MKMRVSGCNGCYEFVLGAGAKVEELATKPSLRGGKKCDDLSRLQAGNNLPMSVLGLGEILELSGCDQFVSIRLCIIFSQVGVASAPL